MAMARRKKAFPSIGVLVSGVIDLDQRCAIAQNRNALNKLKYSEREREFESTYLWVLCV